ncbi:MAG: type II toxin-antitoxin system RelE/ParE family toxin [Eubacterium sp.]|nr:type II toxin-antitoxin system RelE/ParE family toxin [Eubacterium sp.]
MQHYEIKINDLAEKDLEQAGDYIAYVLLNPIAAEKMVRGIQEQVNKLQYFPESHELEDDPVLAELGVRKTYFKEYKIFFVVDKDKKMVYIVRILHMLVDSRMWLYRTLGIEL